MITFSKTRDKNYFLERWVRKAWDTGIVHKMIKEKNACLSVLIINGFWLFDTLLWKLILLKWTYHFYLSQMRVISCPHFPNYQKNNQMSFWVAPKMFWPLTTSNISEMPNLGAPFRDHAYLFLVRLSRWGIMRSCWDHKCLGNVRLVVTEQVGWNSELCLWNCPACMWSMFSIHRPVRHV